MDKIPSKLKKSQLLLLFLLCLITQVRGDYHQTFYSPNRYSNTRTQVSTDSNERCGPWGRWSECNYRGKKSRLRVCTYRKGFVPDYSNRRGDLTRDEREKFEKFYKLTGPKDTEHFVHMPDIQTVPCNYTDQPFSIHHETDRPRLGVQQGHRSMPRLKIDFESYDDGPVHATTLVNPNAKNTSHYNTNDLHLPNKQSSNTGNNVNHDLHPPNNQSSNRGNNVNQEVNKPNNLSDENSKSQGQRNELNPPYENCGLWGPWTECDHTYKHHRSRLCTYRRGFVPDYSHRRGDMSEDMRKMFERHILETGPKDNEEFVHKADIQTEACHYYGEGQNHLNNQVENVDFQFNNLPKNNPEQPQASKPEERSIKIDESQLGRDKQKRDKEAKRLQREQRRKQREEQRRQRKERKRRREEQRKKRREERERRRSEEKKERDQAQSVKPKVETEPIESVKTREETEETKFMRDATNSEESREELKQEPKNSHDYNLPPSVPEILVDKPEQPENITREESKPIQSSAKQEELESGKKVEQMESNVQSKKTKKQTESANESKVGTKELEQEHSYDLPPLIPEIPAEAKPKDPFEGITIPSQPEIKIEPKVEIVPSVEVEENTTPISTSIDEANFEIEEPTIENDSDPYPLEPVVPPTQNSHKHDLAPIEPTISVNDYNKTKNKSDHDKTQKNEITRPETKITSGPKPQGSNSTPKAKSTTHAKPKPRAEQTNKPKSKPKPKPKSKPKPRKNPTTKPKPKVTSVAPVSQNDQKVESKTRLSEVFKIPEIKNEDGNEGKKRVFEGDLPPIVPEVPAEPEPTDKPKSYDLPPLVPEVPAEPMEQDQSKSNGESEKESKTQPQEAKKQTESANESKVGTKELEQEHSYDLPPLVPAISVESETESRRDDIEQSGLKEKIEDITQFKNREDETKNSHSLDLLPTVPIVETQATEPSDREEPESIRDDSGLKENQEQIRAQEYGHDLKPIVPTIPTDEPETFDSKASKEINQVESTQHTNTVNSVNPVAETKPTELEVIESKKKEERVKEGDIQIDLPSVIPTIGQNETKERENSREETNESDEIKEPEFDSSLQGILKPVNPENEPKPTSSQDEDDQLSELDDNGGEDKDDIDDDEEDEINQSAQDEKLDESVVSKLVSEQDESDSEVVNASSNNNGMGETGEDVQESDEENGRHLHSRESSRPINPHEINNGLEDNGSESEEVLGLEDEEDGEDDDFDERASITESASTSQESKGKFKDFKENVKEDGENKARFSRGAKIAGGIIGALLALGAGGTGYHYSNKRTSQIQEVQEVDFDYNEIMDLEEIETAVQITEEVWQEEV